MSKLNNLLETVSKEEMIKLYNETQSTYAMAKKYEVSVQTVIRAMEIYGIERNANKGNRKHSFNDDYFEVIDTEEKAYWLGFIMADGCVYKGTGKTYRLQINLKYDDIAHLNKFQKAIGSDYQVAVKEVGGARVAQLKINSTKLCNDLIALGVTERKSLVCQMPKLPQELIRHFIRGYFDGDGCISLSVNDRLRKSVSILGGEPMLYSINEHLGLTFRQVKGKNVYEIYSQDSDKMIEVYHYLFDDSVIYLSRKKRSYEIVEYILNSPLMK